MVVASLPANRRSLTDATAPAKRSLAAIVRDNGPLEMSDAVDIALDVCDVLANAHANGVVHGDLGLHRVRLQWPRVPDGGIDLFTLGQDDTAAVAYRASAASVLVAPEQREGRPVDARADVWAVAAMLHWMIAGVGPNEGIDLPVPRTLEKAISAALANDPAARPQTIGELAEILSSFSSSPPERFEQLARRRASTEPTKRRAGSDADGVLGRLDDAAIARELGTQATTERLAFRSGTSERSARPPEASRPASRPSHPGVTPPPPVPESTRSVPAVESARSLPAVESARSLPAVATAPIKTVRIAPTADRSQPVTVTEIEVVVDDEPPPFEPWMFAVAAVGALASLAIGIFIGVKTTESLTEGPPRVIAEPSAIIDAPTTAAPTPVVAPAPEEAKGDNVATPSSLPDAKPAARRKPSAPRPKATVAPGALSPDGLAAP